MYRERYFEAIATELAGKADFYYVYILEAHPKSGWSTPGTFTADDVEHFRSYHDCLAAATSYCPWLPHVVEWRAKVPQVSGEQQVPEILPRPPSSPHCLANCRARSFGKMNADKAGDWDVAEPTCAAVRTTRMGSRI